MRSLILTALLPAALILIPGCKTLELATKAGTAVGVATGQISTDQASSINKSSTAVGRAFDKLTPQQEYFIGRSVAASILASYAPYDREAANRYLNTIGQALALASDKPETFGGYHFLIMDTDEVNAFAAPGGLILISRGMLRCCRSEDEVAAVLAHEIGHVQLEHGLRAIKKSRWTSAFTILGAETAKSLGGQQLAELTTAFEGAIGDVTATMVNSGYARKLESEADAVAITILKRVGYNLAALSSMLTEMGKQLDHDERGFAKTHPAPADRIADIAPMIGTASEIAVQKQRTARFKHTLGNI
ncbi:MAG: M48 family metalloprotease [Verrucomicrobia bacterium]|nr:M48 family metalloprotease [Verrucomicrobiota bacterium]